MQDLRACVDSAGPGGDIDRRPPLTDGGKVHAWVYYESLGKAMRYLNAIKRCMEEDKGHRVWKAEVLHEFDEVPGLTDSD
jgi:hypothetical protein